MKSFSLVIGASGGIGKAVVKELALTSDKVFTVSRRPIDTTEYPDKVVTTQIPEQNEKNIGEFVSDLKGQGLTLNTVVITTGFLHNSAMAIHPEKRLDDISEVALREYFTTNTIVPALWLKHLIGVMNKDVSTLVCLSARVGSISDNELGGWYGYRASKAALNMLMKTASVEYNRRLKDVVLVCYHPGTVDTTLSEPFQKNVAANKLFTPSFTAGQLVKHVSSLDRSKACHFIDWDGQVVTW